MLCLWLNWVFLSSSTAGDFYKIIIKITGKVKTIIIKDSKASYFFFCSSVGTRRTVLLNNKLFLLGWENVVCYCL